MSTFWSRAPAILTFAASGGWEVLWDKLQPLYLSALSAVVSLFLFWLVARIVKQGAVKPKYSAVEWRYHNDMIYDNFHRFVKIMLGVIGGIGFGRVPISVENARGASSDGSDFKVDFVGSP